MGQITWTEKASRNLRAIHDYIAQESTTYASRFVRDLIQATDKLKTLPRCGRIVSEFEALGFREVIFQNYRIVYRLCKSDDVEILAVVHGGRELEGALAKEWNL